MEHWQCWISIGGRKNAGIKYPKVGYQFYETGNPLLSTIMPIKKFFFSTRYEEAEVRKKLEEKDRQEKEQLQRQKRQEAGIEDGGTSAKSSLESVLDSKDKTRKVFHIYSER